MASTKKNVFIFGLANPTLRCEITEKSNLGLTDSTEIADEDWVIVPREVTHTNSPTLVAATTIHRRQSQLLDARKIEIDASSKEDASRKIFNL